MKTLTALVLLLAPFVVQSQALYKCGSTFSDKPCGPDAKQIGTPPVVRAPAPPDVPPPAEQVDANKVICEQRTRASMKDPESAKIKSVSRSGTALQYYQGKSFYGVSYHMNVNAKNSYGAYTGETLYNCVFSLDERTWLYSQPLAPWPAG